MVAGGRGFHVLDRRDPQVLGEPTFVVYRLDPVTLGFSEIGGNPEQLLGFPADDWHDARFWPGRLHPEDRKAASDFFAAWATAQRDIQLEYRMIDAAGHTVWVHQIICVGRAPHGQVAIRGVLIDVTDRVAREADIDQALFLRAELFRIIVEELAPPVRAISVFGEMLERHLASQRDHVGSDYAVGVREELQRLDTMLAQLMRIAQAGSNPPDEASAGLAPLSGGKTLG